MRRLLRTARQGWLGRLLGVSLDRAEVSHSQVTHGASLDITDRASAERVLAEAGLGRVVHCIVPLIRPGIHLTVQPAEDDDLPVGASRLGGAPDLPAGFPWPLWKGKPLAFVAQINLRDVSRYDRETLLPPAGLLSFFFDPEQQAWGFDPEHKDGSRVLCFADLGALKRQSLPDDLPSDGRFLPSPLIPSGIFVLPPWRSLILNPTLLTQDERGLYVDLLYDIGDCPGAPCHHLLGHPDAIQGDMQLECQLVSNGLYCGDASGYRDPRRQELEPGAADWQLLLQIDSDEEAGMLWGDDGRIYFWMRRQDLAARDFAQARAILQCY